MHKILTMYFNLISLIVFSGVFGGVSSESIQFGTISESDLNKSEDLTTNSPENAPVIDNSITDSPASVETFDVNVETDVASTSPSVVADVPKADPASLMQYLTTSSNILNGVIDPFYPEDLPLFFSVPNRDVNGPSISLMKSIKLRPNHKRFLKEVCNSINIGSNRKSITIVESLCLVNLLKDELNRSKAAYLLLAFPISTNPSPTNIKVSNRGSSSRIEFQDNYGQSVCVDSFVRPANSDTNPDLSINYVDCEHGLIAERFDDCTISCRGDVSAQW